MTNIKRGKIRRQYVAMCPGHTGGFHRDKYGFWVCVNCEQPTQKYFDAVPKWTVESPGLVTLQTGDQSAAWDHATRRAGKNIQTVVRDPDGRIMLQRRVRRGEHPTR